MWTGAAGLISGRHPGGRTYAERGAQVSRLLEILDPGNPDRNSGLWRLMERMDSKPPWGRVEWDELKGFLLDQDGAMEFGRLDQLVVPAGGQTSAPAYQGTSLEEAEQTPDRYTIERKLGEGHYAAVYLVKDRESGLESAMKLFQKSALAAKEVCTCCVLISCWPQVHAVIREANLLRRMDGHPHIVQVRELIETRQQLLLMLEPVMGGHLYAVISQNRTGFTEGRAAQITGQILGAVAYMHSLNVLHLDLRPENILCTSSEPNFEIKLTDFGLSRHTVDDVGTLKSFVGTPLYAAPEVHGPPEDVVKMLRERGRTVKDYGPPADVWSVGCIMFEMLVGKPPFSAGLSVPALRKLLNEFDGIPPAVEPRSRSSKASLLIQQQLSKTKADSVAQDLLSRMIHPSQARRITAKAAARHAWISQSSQSSRSLADQLAHLRLDNSRRSLRRAVSKILYIRRISSALSQSVGGQAVAKAQMKEARLLNEDIPVKFILCRSRGHECVDINRGGKPKADAHEQSRSTRVLLRRVDGESKGPVCLGHQVQVLSEDGRACLDVAQNGDATADGGHNSWATVFSVRPVGGEPVVMYEAVCGVFTRQKSKRLDIQSCSSAQGVVGKGSVFQLIEGVDGEDSDGSCAIA